MRNQTGGILLIVLGALFLLNNLNLFHWFSLSRFWPVILVVAGVAMLLPRRT